MAYRNLALLVLLSLTTALLMGCGATARPAEQAAPGGEETPVYGGILFNHPGNADPPSLDSPFENTYNLNRPVASAQSTLVRYSLTEDNRLVSDLAEKWDVTPDGKTLTFTLRRGVKFHSGNEFTSADVKFNIERLKGQITSGPGALPNPPRKDLLRAISRVETPDPYTGQYSSWITPARPSWVSWQASRLWRPGKLKLSPQARLRRGASGDRVAFGDRMSALLLQGMTFAAKRETGRPLDVPFLSRPILLGKANKSQS